MKKFSYKDYIKCIHALRLNAVLRLAEERTTYQTKSEQINQTHDKLVKNILKDKEEMSQFVNKFFKLQDEIKKEDLVRVSNSYITKKYKAKEADIVYKLKNEELYFLVEHQSSVDQSMPYRILNYCMDIMQEWRQNNKMKKTTWYPLVVPIVIYTGKQKWTVPTNLKDKQISTLVFENYKINIEYNLIDINKLSNEFLLELDSKFGYGMLIEKSKDKEKLRKTLDMIIQKTPDKNKLEEIANIIFYLLDRILSEEIREELLDKINRKVGEENMCTLQDLIMEEKKRMMREARKEGRAEGREQGMAQGIAEGMTQGICEIVQNMLSQKFDDETIMKATKIEKNKLEKIKSEMQ